jgi:hypothetical protein
VVGAGQQWRLDSCRERTGLDLISHPRTADEHSVFEGLKRSARSSKAVQQGPESFSPELATVLLVQALALLVDRFRREVDQRSAQLLLPHGQLPWEPVRLLYSSADSSPAHSEHPRPQRSACAVLSRTVSTSRTAGHR